MTLGRDTARALLESTPIGLDLDDIRAHILDVPHVQAVHDPHRQPATRLPSLPPASSSTTGASTTAAQLLDDPQTCVGSHFSISVEHSTFQSEQASHAEHESSHH